MNYYAHGRLFLDEPYFLAGTAVPDWLNVVDRKVRVRAKHAAAFLDNVERVDSDPATAAVARGIAQHHRDDGWFHETRAFAELSLGFTAQIRHILTPADDLRPTFLGHILVELLLDATLIGRDPDRLHAYYRAMETVDPTVVERAVNRLISVRGPAFRRNEAVNATESPEGGTTNANLPNRRPPTLVADKLTVFFHVFCRERFLFDYHTDAKLVFRLNQVLRRVGLPPLPEAFAELLSDARAAVADRADKLLAGSVDRVAA